MKHWGKQMLKAHSCLFHMGGGSVQRTKLTRMQRSPESPALEMSFRSSQCHSILLCQMVLISSPLGHHKTIARLLTWMKCFLGRSLLMPSCHIRVWSLYTAWRYQARRQRGWNPASTVTPGRKNTFSFAQKQSPLSKCIHQTVCVPPGGTPLSNCPPRGAALA